MICFYKTSTPGLYEGVHPQSKSRRTEKFVWLILREQKQAPDQLFLEEALHDKVHKGSFIFSGNPLPENSTVRELFKSEILRQTEYSGRGIVWIEDPARPVESTKSTLLINAEGTGIARQYTLPLVDLMKVVLLHAAKIETDGDNITFLSSSGTSTKPAYITPVDMQDKNAVYKICLSFAEEDMGCLKLFRWITKKVFTKVFNPGFEWSFIRNGSIVSKSILMLPLYAADGNDNADFCFSIYPVHILYKKDEKPQTRVYLNQDVTFYSSYTSLYGRLLQLSVKGKSLDRGHFVFEQAGTGQIEENLHRLAPEGDFLIEIPQSKEETLLCGLSGLEYFRIGQGSFLRFAAGLPACVESFPLPSPSPFGPPFDPAADILTDRTTTSWTAVCKAAAYVSQAKGLELFGTNSSTSKTGLLQHEQWETVPGTEALYPLVPYNGVLRDSTDIFSEELLVEYEKIILSNVRKDAINKSLSVNMPGCRMENGKTINVATPGGFMVEVNAQRWEKIHLARNQVFGSAEWKTLSFDLPGVRLVQAFSANNAFLVVVNPDHLGRFSNQINIQDWNFTFNVGEDCKYGEYRNVMIIKSRRGKIYDPADEENSLCSNPQLWTQAEDFASPGGDVTQQLLLASWLKDYCKESLQNEMNRYFDNFNSIIQDPDWRGILFLKMTLKKENIPSNLSGITSGIHNMDEFVLHHVGINLNPIEQENDILVQRSASSLFGLLYYVHPDYHEGTQDGVEPEEGEYDFQMLTLKALFRNSIVQSFESSAQLVVNSMFGCRMKKKDSLYNWIFLNGKCQEKDGVSTYEFRCDKNTELQSESNVLKRISLNSVAMQSLDNEKDDFMFTLSGVADFSLWQGKKEKIDIFSYGTPEENDSSVQGLVFSNMQIIKEKKKPLYSSIEGLRFDLQNSMVRPHSLFSGLKLQLTAIMEKNADPSTMGYAPVLMDGASTSTGEKCWMGLFSTISMGTLGELAGKLAITTEMLIAWTTDTGESEFYIGLKLPGMANESGMLSLQNILKLSLGQISLFHDKDSFLLMISDIAVKLFGIKKLPPDGNTMFYLFGPREEEEGSELGWFALYNK